MVDYAHARQNMVESQLRPNGVTEPAITAAFAAVPRELFVPPARRASAYVDEDLALKPGRFLLEPMVFGKLVQLAAIGRDDNVLDVAAATGYGAAVLAHLARQVTAVEEDDDLLSVAAHALEQVGTANVRLQRNHLRAGWPERAPYDVIIIEGAVEDVPSALEGQLAEGGRLVTVIRSERGIGRGTIFVREHGFVSGRPEFDASTPPLTGFVRERGFVF